MQYENHFQTIAEIAIALAGFSGIVEGYTCFCPSHQPSKPW